MTVYVMGECDMGKAGKPVTAAQRAALAKGREAKLAKRKAAKEAGMPKASERWAMLLDGTLSVKELDDEELARGQVRNAAGVFGGTPRAVPSHLYQAMQAESLRRAQDMFRKAAPKAVKRLLEIAEDPDTKDTDAIRALQLVMERSLGKVPETVRVETTDSWGKMLEESMGDAVDREAMRLAEDAASD